VSVRSKLKGTKIILTALIGAFFLSGSAFAEEGKQDDLVDKESYSIGYQFGDVIKFQGFVINNEKLFAGIRDALEGNNTVMSRAEMKRVLTALQKKTWTAKQKELAERAARNIADGKRFLAENAKKDGIRVLPSGLQYAVLREGDGERPGENDTVKVRYRGMLIDGTEFDSSYGRDEPETLSVTEVIPGWTEALQLMKRGSRWRIFVPPNLGYGERGQPPRIAPNCTLIFDIELISIEKKNMQTGAGARGAAETAKGEFQ
jgi:FKBP-type peptidyl-prolyl cis-trans isomerase FklB